MGNKLDCTHLLNRNEYSHRNSEESTSRFPGDIITTHLYKGVGICANNECVRSKILRVSNAQKINSFVTIYIRALKNV